MFSGCLWYISLFKGHSKYVTRLGGEGVDQKDDKVLYSGRGYEQKSDVTDSKKYCFKFALEWF